ncbi:SGNH/GDSL hydrolase family protein [Amycolatopsis sp. NPDC059657]|uniref:SGNH/GDSL hydrolase family protein n=1 Tax=Amycolatopsis sp. NPDC059657 TaxID=3346899 RepID=UPI00366A8F40
MSARLSAVLAALLLLAGIATPATAATRTYREYVALGDSWTADVVLVPPPSTKYVPFDCAQSARDYPKQVAAALGVPKFFDASCGGATTDDFANPQSGLPLGGTNPPQFAQLTETTDLVTVGIGGNDAGLAGAVGGCINLLPAPLGVPCKPKWVSGGVDRMSENIKAARQKVITAVTQIKQRSPHARILLVDYLAGIPQTGGCWPFQPVLNDDMEWLGAKLRELNAALKSAAATTGVEFVDTHSKTIGHDVCTSPFTRYVEGLLPISANGLAIAVPFHPNSAGGDAQARIVLSKIRG